MHPTDEPGEIVDDLTEKRYKSLAALADADGAARTSDITGSDPALYNQLVRNHYHEHMIPAGLVERLPANGDGENQYRLTERGEAVLEAGRDEYAVAALGEGAARERFEDAEGRIDDLEARVDSIAEDVDLLTRQIEFIVEKIDEVRETRETV